MKTLPAFIVATCLALSGCSANHHSILRSKSLPKDSPRLIAMDSKQRAVLTALGHTGLRFCAEPSPDVFAVMAQAASSNASAGNGVDPKAIEAALAATFSSAEQASTIPRTQTINMLREMMYRTCERYLNGGIDEDELALQAVRDQRLMVSILAIEQMAGVITTKPVALGVSSVAQAAIRLDDQYKQVQEKIKIWEEKNKAYDDLNGRVKCDGVGKGRKECKVAEKERDDAEKEMNDAKEHYEQLRNAMTAAANTAVMLPAAGGGQDGNQSAAIAGVATKIKEIVLGTFDQDEFLLFCLKAMKNKGYPENVREGCITYVSSRASLAVAQNGKKVAEAELVAAQNEEEAAKIELEMAQRKAKAADIWESIQRHTGELFDKFWARISQNDSINQDKLDKFRQEVTETGRTWPGCFEGKTTKEEFKSCFFNESSNMHRFLAGEGW